MSLHDGGPQQYGGERCGGALEYGADGPADGAPARLTMTVMPNAAASRPASGSGLVAGETGPDVITAISTLDRAATAKVRVTLATRAAVTASAWPSAARILAGTCSREV